MNDDATAIAGWIIIGTAVGVFCAIVAAIARRLQRR